MTPVEKVRIRSIIRAHTIEPAAMRAVSVNSINFVAVKGGLRSTPKNNA